ncbi:hypothetical protein APHAL10511_006837 [Amanita phalloides]|nr:hypothetical protein APHAL10511_006837 [Amanita phalloides]
MAKASLTLVFFLFATVFGIVSARPLERRDVAQFREDLDHVSHSVHMFADQVSALDTVSPALAFPGFILVGLESMSSGFGECANDLNDVDSIPYGDSQGILEQMEHISPTFVSSMNQLAAAYETAHGPVKRDVGKALRDIRRTINNLGNNLRRTVNDLASKTHNKRQKAAYQHVGNQMLDAVQNASPSQ